MTDLESVITSRAGAYPQNVQVSVNLVGQANKAAPGGAPTPYAQGLTTYTLERGSGCK